MARSVMFFGRDPEAEEAATGRVLVHAKNNLGPPGPSHEFEWADDTLVWTGRSELTVADLMVRARTSRGRTALQRAMEFLAAEVEHGPRAAEELFRLGADERIAERTLRRARAALGIVSDRPRRADGTLGPAVWSFPRSGTPASGALPFGLPSSASAADDGAAA